MVTRGERDVELARRRVGQWARRRLGGRRPDRRGGVNPAGDGRDGALGRLPVEGSADRRTAGAQGPVGQRPRRRLGVGQGIVHWNGAAWTERRTSEFFIQTLNAVWGNDRDDVWAVGRGANLSLERRSLAQRTSRHVRTSSACGEAARGGLAVGSLGRSFTERTSWSVFPVSAVSSSPVIDSRSRLDRMAPRPPTP